jgi:integrase
MPRPATGQAVRRESGVWALRFRACGARQYQTLGTAEEGWTRQKAEQALRHVMADVERGTWRPPHPEPASEANPDPSFHEFASEWFEATKSEWREKTRLDYEWQLAHHLLPFFRDHRLSQITAREIDRYRQGKVAEGQAIMAAATRGKPLIEEYADKHGRRCRRPRRALSATSINKTITRLGQILEVAVEYGLIAANPAKSRRRRLKAQKAIPVWLDRAEHIEALLDAAGELDRQAKVKGGHDQKGGPAYRRALLTTLVFAGLRIGELTALQWRDVDLAGNRITVRMSKTDAGVRQIDLLPALRDELDAYKVQTPSTAPNGYVFATTSGTEPKQGNIRRRVLDKAVERANEKLSEAGDIPLPDGLTPHKLRHTFASILVALGVDPGSVMDQLGHTDPSFTLRVYRHGMRRDRAARERLRGLVGAADWAPSGTGAQNGALAQFVAVGPPGATTA